MKKTLFSISAIAIVILLIVVSVSGCTSPAKEVESIMVYSGAGMREPMDEIGVLFEEEYGTKIEYNYAGSNALLSQMEVTQEGDVYMPGETYYLEVADEKGFIDKQELIAYHIPVITVPAGNPASIEQLSDLTKDGVRVVWGDPEAAAIGKLGNEIMEKNGLLEALQKNIVATVPTMNELIVYVSEGQAELEQAARAVSVVFWERSSLSCRKANLAWLSS